MNKRSASGSNDCANMGEAIRKFFGCNFNNGLAVIVATCQLRDGFSRKISRTSTGGISCFLKLEVNRVVGCANAQNKSNPLEL